MLTEFDLDPFDVERLISLWAELLQLQMGTDHFKTTSSSRFRMLKVALSQKQDARI